MRTASFCKSVLIPLAAIIGTLLISGCEQPSSPVAPMPRHQVWPDRPAPPEVKPAPPQVIAFGAEWCSACRAGQEKLTALQRRGVIVERVNIDTSPEKMEGLGITSIPVYFVFRSGHETVRTQDIDEAVKLIDEVL
jgi:thiol-disulfide isomerase/thioredoxin